MKSNETPTNGKKKQSHNKLKSRIENVVRATINYNECNEIYNSNSLQWKEIIGINYKILLIVLNKNKNIAYSIECWFINVNFLLLLFF